MQGVRNGVAGLSFCMAGGRPPDLQEVCEPPCWPTVVFEIAVNSVMGNIKCPLSVFFLQVERGGSWGQRVLAGTEEVEPTPGHVHQGTAVLQGDHA